MVQRTSWETGRSPSTTSTHAWAKVRLQRCSSRRTAGETGTTSAPGSAATSGIAGAVSRGCSSRARVPWTAVTGAPASVQPITSGVEVLIDHYDEDWTRVWWARADGTARVLGDDPRAIALLADRYDQFEPAGAVIAVEVARRQSRGISAGIEVERCRGEPEVSVVEDHRDGVVGPAGHRQVPVPIAVEVHRQHGRQGAARVNDAADGHLGQQPHDGDVALLLVVDLPGLGVE